MDDKRLYMLEKMPVKQAVINLASPVILGMVVQIFYNLTDTFFIGKLNDPIQVAALTLTLPLFMMQMALAGIFGAGGVSYLSRLLGEKNYPAARQTNTSALVSTAAMAILTGLLGLLFLRQILAATGASTATLPYATGYMRIIFAGSIISMLSFTISQLLRAEGAARISLMGMLWGTGANIVLDPLFILVFHMGVQGAAIATIIGNAISVVYYLSFYISGKSMAAPGWKYLHLEWKTMREMLKIGIPSSLGQIMMSIGNSISYRIASGYGDNTVAAMGISMRVFTIPIFIFIGLAVGVQPLVGYSYGARNYTRLRQAVNTGILFAGILAAFFTLLFIFFSKYAVAMFIQNPEVIRIGSQMLRAYLLAIPFAAVQMEFGSALQAMGKGLESFILSISRMGLIFIPAILILSHFFGFSGMIFALPLTDFLTTGLAFAFISKILIKLESKDCNLEEVVHHQPGTANYQEI